MYTNHRYEVRMTSGTAFVDVTSTGDKAVWGPAFVPHIVRAVAISLSADPADTGTVKFDLRPTRGSDTSRTDGTVGTIELLTTHNFTAGELPAVIYHVPTSPVTVYPGQEVVCEVTASAAGPSACSVSMWVEAFYDDPDNQTGMTATT